MADIPFSEDSSSTSIFDLLAEQKLNLHENLVPSGDTFNKVNGNENSATSSSHSKNVSDEVENEITDSLEQLSTSCNQDSPSPEDGNDVNVQSDEEEEQFRKRVRVGNHYQARIPKYVANANEAQCSDSEQQDLLLWDPFVVHPEAVDSFLRQLTSIAKLVIPMGTHVRDNEHALYILQQNGHNIEYSLQLLSTKSTEPDKKSEWTEEECKNFESGLLNYGKNFYVIQKNKVNSRSVGELVQFYYLWKKSERFDLLASRIRSGKKKYILNPGISDLMIRYFGNHRTYSSIRPDVQLIVADNKKEQAPTGMQY